MTFSEGEPTARRALDPIVGDDELEVPQGAPRRVAPADPSAVADQPIRRARRARKTGRTGLVAFTAGAIAAASIGLATFASSAMATDAQGSTPVVEPFDRTEDTTRSDDREALDEQAVADAVTARNQALTEADQEITAADAADAAAERQTKLTDTTEEITSEAKRLEEDLNKLVFPAEGKVGSQWGMRLHPILGYYRMHAGVDIGAACGTPLRAVYDGVVTVAAYDGGSGNHVKIYHGTFRGKTLVTSSLHMTEYIVEVGQEVKKGEIIGYTGSTGLSTECHLHFETLWGGENVDPEPLLADP